MPQIPFAFEFECEWPNDLCMVELPFGCSEIFISFLLKMVGWQFGRTFQISAIHIQAQTQTETEGHRMHMSSDVH